MTDAIQLILKNESTSKPICTFVAYLITEADVQQIASL
jgi:hypothetical protein